MWDLQSQIIELFLLKSLNNNTFGLVFWINIAFIRKVTFSSLSTTVTFTDKDDVMQ